MGTKLSQLQYEKTQFRCTERIEWQDTVCIKKVTTLRMKQDKSFILDDNSILWKMVRLRYIMEPIIVVAMKLTSIIIAEFHNGKDHQGISHTVNMIRHYFWWGGMCRNVPQHISNCQLCIQFLPNWSYMQSKHLEIAKVPFAGCAIDCIGPLPATSRAICMLWNLYACCLCISLQYYYKVKWQMRSQWHILKKFSLRPCVLNLFYKIRVPNIKNKQLIFVLNTLGIKCTILKFTYGSQFEWNNALPLATYCYNIAPLVDDLESPFYLVFGWDP